MTKSRGLLISPNGPAAYVAAADDLAEHRRRNGSPYAACDQSKRDRDDAVCVDFGPLTVSLATQLTTTCGGHGQRCYWRRLQRIAMQLRP